MLDNVSFENVKLRNIDLTGAFIENVIFDKYTMAEGIYGLDDSHIKSINIGTAKQPQYIKEKEVIQWLKHRMNKQFARLCRAMSPKVMRFPA